MVASLLVLHYREHLLDLRLPKPADVWRSWKAIGEVAIPAIITNVIVPFGSAVVTRLVAEYGPSAVAAWGVGSDDSAGKRASTTPVMMTEPPKNVEAGGTSFRKI